MLLRGDAYIAVEDQEDIIGDLDWLPLLHLHTQHLYCFVDKPLIETNIDKTISNIEAILPIKLFRH